ncbi:Carbamoyl-phosphate [Rhizoctonia solani]|uniref:Ammonium-dependent carbamoyl phosphate synthetase n=1 Tax=Rhizoctonia solani TaxID=456999 RepID=A0A8H7ID50_9AGAM|nr:Carbamoyl-phosphate [Rhizoctonia solani]
MVTLAVAARGASGPDAVLELADGTTYSGINFGAAKSIAGECVFQTGMVGYTESLTDPSYEGQILVLTYPLIGNYGVPERIKAELDSLPAEFESSRIHVAGLVVAAYSEEYSHFLAQSSLGAWLKENNVPAIYGVDTRALTKRIRDKGSMLGRITIGNQEVPFSDPNVQNLVAQVSIKKPQLYTPSSVSKAQPRQHPSGRPLRVVAFDVGMKYNQIRCFTSRGVELLVVPWDYDLASHPADSYDGVFISNGPGDPSLLTPTITQISRLISLPASAAKPVFGICLGHQLLALAAGATTSKMKYGNRGHNIPCSDTRSGRCYITSQNHGFQVEAKSLPQGWHELFVNANDGSNEGIYCSNMPFFSVQFHPESTPGPRDTEFLFDVFIENIASQPTRCSTPIDRIPVKKVLVLGSGGLSIGQAGEFDYSGSQAIKALKEEGIYTVLVNPNIATIATSKGLADKVYFLPVTPEFVRKIIKYERPDDEFESLGCRVLGTPIETIIMTEDRQLFADAMAEIGEKCAQSASAATIDEARAAAKTIGFPVIVRAAYALGGLGSGFAQNQEQLDALCAKAFATSPQVLVEKSMKGWKEIEYEVVRDCRDNCITVCNMENFDPLGIHTGDSIVIAPSQTLSDQDYNMLRTTAINVIRHLGVVGECNIQYALNPTSKEYCIIEVQCSSFSILSLASKATGYPLAFIAAKLGYTFLNAISNSVTRSTTACFEPSRVSKLLSSSMKSVGEVMSVARTFEEAIQKAIRAIDDSFVGFAPNGFVDDIDEELVNPTDKRIFAIADAFQRGYSVEKIWEMSNIDRWFLTKLKGIWEMEQDVVKGGLAGLTSLKLRNAKQYGFSDRHLASCLQSTEIAIRRLRQEYAVYPFVKQIDTVAAEFPAYTNYLYMTYNAVSTTFSSMITDSAIRTLRDQGIKTIMVNYNPETVSTDYDEADRLYPVHGWSDPNNIALPLHRQNVKIYGTSPEMIDTAENRYKFSRLLDTIGVDQPQWKELTSFDEAFKFCEKVKYPVLVRPSYVLSGAAMNVVSSPDDLASYLTQATAVSRDHPVVISKYIEEAKEIEMDAVARDGKLVMHYISEHIENAGVHSGDATLVLPPQDLDPETIRKIEDATSKIGNALNVTGPFNIQFIAKNNEIKVIECNLRAARSFPFVSKVSGVDAIELATRVMMGLPVEPYPPMSLPENYVGVKVPQFSFSRLSGADPVLGVEMASTGEVACFGKTSYKEKLEMLPSVQKLHQAGYRSLRQQEQPTFSSSTMCLASTWKPWEKTISKTPKVGVFAHQHLANNLIDMYINLPSKNKYRRPASYSSKGYRTRRMAVDFAIPLITNVKCAKLLVEALVRRMPLDVSNVDYKTSHDTYVPRTEVTKASICGGFTTVQVIAHGAQPGSGITDTNKLDIAQSNAVGAAHCHYALSAMAAGANTKSLDEDMQAETKALFIPFRGPEGGVNDIGSVAAHFASWPNEKPVITDAATTDLASVLLLASLHGRSVHAKSLKVTCDVSVYALFFSQDTYPGATCLPNADDQKALWENIKHVDVFSIGTTPYLLATQLGKTVSPKSGIYETLPLLLSAVAQGKLSLDDISKKLHDNPISIFGLAEQVHTQVEVVVDRKAQLPPAEYWSPLEGTAITGFVHRVVVHGSTVFLDGIASSTAMGRDLSSATSVPRTAQDRALRASFVGPRRPSVSATEGLQTAPLVPYAPATASGLAPQGMSILPSTLRQHATPSLGTLAPHPAFHRRHILSVRQFTHDDLHYLFNLAGEMRLHVERSGTLDLLRGRVLCTLFYEPSTRTSASFEAAMKRLGGDVVAVTADSSSVAKEKTAAKFSPVPVLNAGDGVGEHPTQALLDIYTIRSELGTVNGRTITLLGDLKNGRTVHSLVNLLCFYSVQLNFVSPPSLRCPNLSLLPLDVLRERFESDEAYESVKNAYVINQAVLARAKEDMIVMHPLPRLQEIDPDVDFDSRRAVYFRQMRYGLFIRMALLASILA